MIKHIVKIIAITFVTCLFFSPKAHASSTLKDKTVVFMGDSLTENFEKEGKSYPDIIQHELGIQSINLGLGGTSMSSHPNKDFNAFSFINLIDATINQKFELQEKALKNKDIPEYFGKKLDLIKKINWDKVSIVVIMYGANDWGKPLDNPDNAYDTNTFKGAARQGIKQIMDKNPDINFLLIPTPYRYWPEYNNVDSFSSKNSLGLMPFQYSEAMEEVAKEFNIPVVDSLYSLGINQLNKEEYFLPSDGTHFNEKGNQKLAEIVKNTLDFYY